MLFIEAVKGKIFKCDNCRKTFKGEDIKLEQYSENIKIITPLAPFIFVDKDGKMMSSSESPHEGDQIGKCPLCDYPHLFGFEAIS